MSNFIPGLAVGLFLCFFSYVGGRENGWKDVYRGDVVCQTLLDSNIHCVPKEMVKK